VFEVFTLTLTHFLAKTIFSRGYRGGGVNKILVEILGGGGGYSGVQNMEIFERRGVCEIPSVVRVFPGTTQ